jgi:ADP-heptose:LPS heptosyltransferase
MWGLSIWLTAIRRNNKPPDPRLTKEIVVFQFGGIGDMIIMTAALRALAQRFKKANISIVCSVFHHARDLLRYPYVKDLNTFRIYALDSKGILNISFWKEIYRTIKKLRSNHIDLLVNFHNPKLIDWFLIEFTVIAASGAKYTMGSNPWFMNTQSIYDKWISESELNGKHYKDFFLQIVEPLGIKPKDYETDFPLLRKDRDFAENLMRRHHLYSDRLVCIHPSSSEEIRRWPREKFREVCKRLGHKNINVVLIGSKSDRVLVEYIARDISSVISLSGQVTIGQSAAVIRKSAVFIGNDSGPFHLAIAVKTPAVGIIGGGLPEYHLYRREDIRIIKKETQCAPCRNSACRHKTCLEAITVDEVLQATADLSERSKRI